jgi:N-acetylglutamate synthase
MVAQDAETAPHPEGARPQAGGGTGSAKPIDDGDATHRLDVALAARGYTVLDRTLVMARAIQSENTDHAPPYTCRGMSATLYRPALSTLEIDAWLPLYARFSGVGFQTQTGHAAILHQIMLESLPAALMVNGAPVACGMGVLDGDYFGLFDLVTDPAQRRRGYGAHLVQAMLAWAAARGAQIAYLQVVEENHTARTLYSRAGFTPRYRYWYRVPHAS